MAKQNDKETIETLDTTEITDTESTAVFAFVISDMLKKKSILTKTDYSNLTDEHVQRLKQLNKAISG